MPSFLCKAVTAFLVVGCTLLGTPAPQVSARGGAGGWTWRPSGLVGGGFQNVIAAKPRVRGGYVVGGELSGFHLTGNAGTRWTTSNRFGNNTIGSHVAALATSKARRGWVYAAVGAALGGGGFLRSKNGGRTWRFQAVGGGAPKFSALRPLCGGTEHPRATGSLIVPDDADTPRIFVGSLGEGVQRSTDAGKTWDTIALPGAYVRTLVRAPRDRSTLYAGVCQANGFSGAYRIDRARSRDPIVTHLGAAPPTVEEFAIVRNRIYAVANTTGVFRVRRAGRVWDELGRNFFSSASKWGAIAGFSRGPGRDVLYVGGSEGVLSKRGGYRTVAKSTNGGRTWRWLGVNPDRVHARIAGTSTPWWYVTQNPLGSFGARAFVASQIVVDPHRRKRVLIAGRGGIWRSGNAGRDWRPIVNGLLSSLTLSVAAKGDKMYAGTGDWTVFGSNDHGRHVRRFVPGGGSYGYAVTIGPDGAVYLGSGNVSANAEGNVFSNANPFSSPWANLDLPDDRRVVGVAVGEPGGGGKVVLAALQAGGVWRRFGSGWTQVAPHASIPVTSTRVSFAWAPATSSYVYLAVPGAGLYRSTDGGVSWVRIWSRSALDVAVDPRTDGSRIYVQTAENVFRLGDARVGTVEAGTISPHRLSVDSGRLAVDGGGRVYVAGSGPVPGFFESTDQGGTWRNRATAYYRRAANFPTDLALSGDGRFYVGLRSNGVVIGRRP